MKDIYFSYEETIKLGEFGKRMIDKNLIVFEEEFKMMQTSIKEYMEKDLKRVVENLGVFN